ncbi:MAG: glutamine amidotransferase [Thaumarchaeota archaeon]|nr:glutamine amidotransferase [Nitrososphaerota archaeon]
MESTKKISVLYVGDNIDRISIMHVGYDFVFNNEAITEGRLEVALREDPQISVRRIWGTAIARDFPNSQEELSKYDAMVLSDVGSDTLLITPELMHGSRVPNRHKLIREYVRNGGGLVMIGGYWSFGGFRGIARYHGTPVEEALPVVIKDGDDRVEVPEGFSLLFSNHDHSTLSNLDRKQDHYFLGYNQIKDKPDSTILATYGNDPIMVVGSFGKGRTMAFASDCDLHWGGSFVTSSNYVKFWRQSIRWLAKL